MKAALALARADRRALLEEIRRLRSVIATGARTIETLLQARELLTIEKQALEHRLACRDRLLEEAERECGILHPLVIQR